jgi:zinc/manganese transport system permease protein
VLYPFLRDGRGRALRVTIAAARWGAAAILFASALQFAAAPRADQPLIDAAEYLVPSLRALYFSPAEQAGFADAAAYAERYRVEADQLNEREKRTRTEGQALDDFAVARISSFLKSYGEMRKGEEFVMSELRARARERIRWTAGAGLLGCALLLAPIAWRRLRLRPLR